MKQFSESPRPKSSPWGAIQGAKQIMPGVCKVDTASHGGMILSQERMDAMPDACKCNCYGGDNCFEEDCEWALVAVAFPEEFFAVSPNSKQYVAQTLGKGLPMATIGPYKKAADLWEGMGQ